MVDIPGRQISVFEKHEYVLANVNVSLVTYRLCM